MYLIGWISFALLVTTALAAPPERKPFLQRLIEDGFKSSSINVVYFIYGKYVAPTLFRGSYPRVLIGALEGQSKTIKGRSRFLKIAPHSLVVIDVRSEPMQDKRSLIYLMKELQRIHNPVNNKFVLMVDKSFRKQERVNLKNLQDVLFNLGIGYTVVLPYDQDNSPEDPTVILRISFGHQQTIRLKNSVNFKDLFRFDTRSLDGMRVSGILYNFFPFSYIAPNRRWVGTDFSLWSVIIMKLRLRLQFIYAKGDNASYVGGAYSPAMLNRTVDFIATRDMVVRDGRPKLLLHSRDHFSLIVPRPTTLNLIDALLQPFSGDVWLMIGVLFGIHVMAGYWQNVFRLLDRGGTVRKRVGFLLDTPNPWPQWVALASDVLTFLLIEAYLAQVTSLLLTLRYIEGPQDLNEFLASNILIVKPFESTNSLMQLEAGLRAQLKTRFVQRTSEELGRADQHDAYVELRSRVLWQSYGTEPYDPVTGRRNFYILDEPLAVVRFQYSFSKETAFMKVVEEFMLMYEESGLRKRSDEEFEYWARYHRVRKDIGFNRAVLGLTDLNSLWICMALGWLASGLVLLIERSVYLWMLRRVGVMRN